jgi:hypothetical protein
MSDLPIMTTMLEQVSRAAPVYAETYGAVYGELLWRPRIELPLAPDRHGRQGR